MGVAASRSVTTKTTTQTDDEQQAALDRIAAIDGWHDEQRSSSDEAA
ncbi:hypothetical protein ACF1DY_29655 [Streptomyces albus]